MMADTGVWRFQEFQFDRDLDPEWLRALKEQQRVGGRAAHELRDLWEGAILARIKLLPESARIEPPLLSHCRPVQALRKLTLTALQRCYSVEIHVKVRTRVWETVLIGNLSREQAAPFLHRGRLRRQSYGPVLPLVVRHRVYADAVLLGRPELRCLLAGKLPELRLV